MIGNMRGLCGLMIALGVLAAGAARAEDTGTLKGVIYLQGKAPQIKNIFSDIKTEPKCAEQYEKPQVKAQEILLAKAVEGKEDLRPMQSAMIFISTDLSGKTFPAATEKKTLNQQGCLYIPHVLTLQTDQTLLIKNSDPLLHNINASPAKNPPFNYGQPQKDMENPVAFKKAEIFKVKCDVHKWMGAWIGVFPHPFHAVSNEKGEYEIKGLPAGEYEVTFWHEVYGEFKEKVTVKTSDNAKDYTFKAEASAGG